MSGIQLSLFDISQRSMPVLDPSSGEDIDSFLLKYWSNSEDLAACIVNVLLHSNELLFEFVEYIKTCRLAEVTEEVPRLAPRKRFDRLAECLKRLEFSRFERGDKGEVLRTETTVLDFAIDISFDERELDELRAFGVAGASTQNVEELAEVIRNYVEEAEVGDTQEEPPRLDQSPAHPYIAMLRQLGIPEESIPEAGDTDAVLKAMLDGIGESPEKFDAVLLDTDITKSDLLSAGGPAERKRLYRILAKKLEHELACFSGTEQWYRHGGFWRHEILLTDGVMYLAENGGRNCGTAFWLIDAIASYQGEKLLARHPFQVWKLSVTEVEGQSRCATLVCTNGNNEKPIVEQDIEYTDFLLDAVQLYASVEPVDELGKQKRVIILLPGEY
jgi:hypothetical protein